MDFNTRGPQVLHNGEDVCLYGENLQINSSMIKSAAYHPSVSILQIEFSTGSTYAYFNVPKEAYLDFATAKSKGKCFHATIKDQFQYKRISG